MKARKTAVEKELQERWDVRLKAEIDQVQKVASATVEEHEFNVQAARTTQVFIRDEQNNGRD